MRIPYKPLLLGLLAGSLPWGAARAAVSAVVVPVEGMTCVVCTRGVEQSIKSMPGVAEVAADLSSGRVRVTAADGASLDLRRVKDRVRAAGFRVGGECELTASGRFQLGPERRLTFRPNGTAYVWQVLEGGQVRRMFKRHPGLRQAFVVRARLHEHPGWKPAAVTIMAFEPVSGPAARPSLSPPENARR